MNQKNIKNYSDLSHLYSYEDRFNYLKINNSVGLETFGYDRYLNQQFYKSEEWKKVRDQVIIRDNGCDMGLKDYPIHGKIYIHHIEPLTLEDVTNGSYKMLDPNNLVCVSHATHNAIHFGSDDIVKENKLIERAPNDTCPWRK